MSHPDQLFSALRTFVADIDARKKQATDGVGETTHPSESVEDGTQDPSTGARASENEKDVKDSVQGLSVNEATDPSPTKTEQNDVQPNIGPQQSATGEDPSVEDDYKATKDDAGTSHPAKADDGEKYASASFEALVAQFGKVAESILADVAVDGAAARRTPPSAKSAAAAGYATAAAAGSPTDRAARAARTIEDTIKEAHHAAELVARFLPQLYETMQKQAEGDEPPDDDDSAKDPGGDPAPKGDPGAMHGDPAGGDPAMGGGGPMGQGGEEMLSQMLGQPEAPPSHDEAMGGVNGAMDDLQISPEILQQIIALLQQAGADGGGEAPIKQARLLQKVASEARKFRRSGKYEIGPAKTARAREIRTSMRNYLSEVLNSVPLA